MEQLEGAIAKQAEKTFDMISSKLGLRDLDPREQELQKQQQNLYWQKKAVLAEAQISEHSVARLKNSLKVFKQGTHMFNSTLKKYLALTLQTDEANVTDDIISQVDLGNILGL